MRKSSFSAMQQNKSFIEKLNGVNFGRTALIFSLLAVGFSLGVKLFYVPKIEKNFTNNFFTQLKFWIALLENIAILIILAFFCCIFFFRKTIGAKMLFYMQHKGKYHPKDRWILLWMKSLIIALVLIGITTFVTATFFKSWIQYGLLVVLICLPFLLKNKMNFLQNKIHP